MFSMKFTHWPAALKWKRERNNNGLTSCCHHSHLSQERQLHRPPFQSDTRSDICPYSRYCPIRTSGLFILGTSVSDLEGAKWVIHGLKSQNPTPIGLLWGHNSLSQVLNSDGGQYMDVIWWKRHSCPPWCQQNQSMLARDSRAASETHHLRDPSPGVPRKDFQGKFSRIL